jgi:hypothetical protein
MRQRDIDCMLPRKLNSIQFLKKNVKIGKKIFFFHFQLLLARLRLEQKK